MLGHLGLVLFSTLGPEKLCRTLFFSETNLAASGVSDLWPDSSGSDRKLQYRLTRGIQTLYSPSYTRFSEHS